MERSSAIDQFLMLQPLFVDNLFFDHHVDKCSAYDPLFINLNIDISRIDFASRVSGHRLNWSEANCDSLVNYR
jgi:hypothetical protein